MATDSSSASARLRAAPFPPRAHRVGGLTLVEFVVVVCLIGVLVAVALDRLLALRADAERAALEQVWGSLRVAMSLQMLAFVLEGRDAELPTLRERNPIDFLNEPPPNYAGEFDDPDPASFPGGRWYFDRSRSLLVYRVRYPDEFASELPGPPRVRLRVAFSFADRDGDGRFDPGRDEIGGVRVVSAEKFSWRGLKSQGS